MLSIIVFLPAAGAVLLAVLPTTRPQLPKFIAAATTLLDLALVLGLWRGFDAGTTAIQYVQHIPWVPTFNISYYVGIDGLSLPMVFLTALLGFLVVLISWGIDHRVKLYFSLLLVLQTGILGVFTSLDFVLFFLFWEVELLPMYLLISIWGSPPPLGGESIQR